MHANISCGFRQKAYKLSKVQNNALENDISDCKAECKLKDGCIGFMIQPSTICRNLASLDLKKCKEKEGYHIFFNGRYTNIHRFTYHFYLLLFINCICDPIAANKSHMFRIYSNKYLKKLIMNLRINFIL